MTSVLTIQICHDRLRLVTGDQQASEGTFDTQEELSARLEELLPADAPTGWRLDVGRPWAQVRQLRDLPPVKARHLSGLVAGGADRYFRMRPGPLHVEAERIDTETVCGIAIDAWLAEAVARVAHRHRAVLHGVCAVGADEVRYPLVPGAVRRSRRRAALRHLLTWVPVALVPWLAAGALYAADLRADLRSLESGLGELQAAEVDFRAVEEELGSASQLVEATRRTSPEEAWALPFLARLARALPPTAAAAAITARRDGTCSMQLVGDLPDPAPLQDVFGSVTVEETTVTLESCR